MRQIEGLTKKYPGFTLSIPGLTFEKGYVYGIVGKNGAGKTTLIKCMLNLLDYEGIIKIDGAQINDKNHIEIFNSIGYVGDNLNLNDELSMGNQSNS